MSFVIPKAQRKTIFHPREEGVGPGEYNLQQSKLNEHCAPFNSSQGKVSYFDVEQKIYGPGYYKQVDMKQLYQPKKNLLTTAAFASKVNRFITHTSSSSTDFYITSHHPSTNNHDQQLQKAKSAMMDLRQRNRQKRVEAIKGTQKFIRVILSNPKNTQCHQSHYISPQVIQRHNGPGSYQVQESQVRKHPTSVTKWDHSNKPRFQKPKSISPGVGHYDVKEYSHNKNKPSPSFAFSGLRSHIDQLIYKTSNPLKVKVLQIAKVKNSDPGPGYYQNLKDTHKSFSIYENSFGRVKRFEEQEHDKGVGPGQYEINSSFKKNVEFYSTLKDMRKKIFSNKIKHNPNTHPKISKSLAIIPTQTPNQNQLKLKKNTNNNQQLINSLKQRCTSKYGDMSQQMRFKSQQNDTKSPYYIAHQNLQKAGHKYIFQSSSNRLIPTSNQSLPFYETNIFDIGKKQQKTKAYIANLKNISIQKLPFGSGSKRFKTEVKPQKKQHIQNSVVIMKRRPLEKSPVFKSTTQRQVFKERDTSVPGPGQYEKVAKSLEKKSFNLNYNYQVPFVVKHIDEIKK